MGLLDEAIREHLELKRRRGADPAEIARQEHEALSPPTRTEAQGDRDDQERGEGDGAALDEPATAFESRAAPGERQLGGQPVEGAAAENPRARLTEDDLLPRMVEPPPASPPPVEPPPAESLADEPPPEEPLRVAPPDDAPAAHHEPVASADSPADLDEPLTSAEGPADLDEPLTSAEGPADLDEPVALEEPPADLEPIAYGSAPDDLTEADLDDEPGTDEFGFAEDDFFDEDFDEDEPEGLAPPGPEETFTEDWEPEARPSAPDLTAGVQPPPAPPPHAAPSPPPHAPSPPREPGEESPGSPPAREPEDVPGDQPTQQYALEDLEEATGHRAPPGGPGPGETDEDELEGDDVLEETPEFLEETPEHDRLWFEQKPPRDFDF